MLPKADWMSSIRNHRRRESRALSRDLFFPLKSGFNSPEQGLRRREKEGSKRKKNKGKKVGPWEFGLKEFAERSEGDVSGVRARPDRGPHFTLPTPEVKTIFLVEVSSRVWRGLNPESRKMTIGNERSKCTYVG